MMDLRWEVSCCIAIAAAGWTGAAPVQAQAVAVAPAEQAARDADRVRILEDELQQVQQRADDAVRRRSERLAAHDATGVEAAEQARARALSDLAALQRELETARSPRPAVPGRAVGAARPGKEAVWWNVYARAPSRASAAVSR